GPATTLAPQHFDLGDRELWIDATNAPIALVDGPGTVSGANVVTSDERVTVTSSATTPVTIAIPSGAHIHIRSDNGSLTATVAVASADVSMTNGSVTL